MPAKLALKLGPHRIAVPANLIHTWMKNYEKLFGNDLKKTPLGIRLGITRRSHRPNL